MPGSRSMSERGALRGLARGACVLLVAVFLCACGPDDEDAARRGDGAPRETAAPVGSATGATGAPGAPQVPAAVADAVPATPEPALTPEERVLAERALEFHNTALSALEEGYYALPDALYANARLYLKTWRLPRRPRPADSREAARARLTPGSGLFSEEEAARLATALDGMDKALDSLLGRYRSLERYVADPDIRDDGARGTALARKLEGDHAVFMAARKSWLEIVGARAAAAEAALLREHPLQRQIRGAESIFACFARTAAALGAEDANGSGTATQGEGTASSRNEREAAARAELERIHAELEADLAASGKPPFPAAPELERRYRAVLKEASAYADALGRGLADGFFGPQRRELNVAAARSRAAYNAFARAANGLRTR